jgi:small GTP-binding protein
MTDFVFKICLLGDGGVGKTSLVYRFIENRFSRDFKSTLGVNLLKKRVQIREHNVICQIWDLGGQAAYRKLRKLYLEGSQGALLVYDITSRPSFDNMEEWIQTLFEARNQDVPLIIIGNKLDLEQNRQVKLTEAMEYAKKKNPNIKVLETSAATGDGVEQAFLSLAELVLAKHPKGAQ